MSYRITKTYGHDLGLSACFRQHRASSHCQFLHGYALSFKFTFEADELDERNWVLDFGGLKRLKDWLCDTFDHKLLIASDDPALDRLTSLADGRGVWNSSPVADVLVVEAVGCEAFARMAWHNAAALLEQWRNREVAPLTNGVRLVEVEVREHGANSAIYTGE
jgi:6-pyruvoyltetrahydropterin/6-carboxytetrahydropterin synthase